VGSGAIPGQTLLAGFDLLGSKPALRKVEPIDQHSDDGQDQRPGAQQKYGVAGQVHRTVPSVGQDGVSNSPIIERPDSESQKSFS
jgi:hypothetical protein